jgi:hypothetical protein
MAIARSTSLHAHRGPLQAGRAAPRRSLCAGSARSRLLAFPRHRGQIVICAASDKDGPKQPEPPTALVKAAGQLAGATALAAVTVSGQLLVAVVGTVQGSLLPSHASIHSCSRGLCCFSKTSQVHTLQSNGNCTTYCNANLYVSSVRYIFNQTPNCMCCCALVPACSSPHLCCVTG